MLEQPNVTIGFGTRTQTEVDDDDDWGLFTIQIMAIRTRRLVSRLYDEGLLLPFNLHMQPFRGYGNYRLAGNVDRYREKYVGYKQKTKFENCECEIETRL